MKKLHIIIGLSAFLIFAGCSIKIRGQWDADLPTHFIAENYLEAGESYIIGNGTSEYLSVFLLNNRTPLRFFLIPPGESRQFYSPGDSFDIGIHSRTISGVSLWWVPD